MHPGSFAPSLALALLVFTSACATSRTLQSPRQEAWNGTAPNGALVTGMLGMARLELPDTELDSGLGDVTEVEDSTLPVIGAVYQQPVVGQRVRFGFEGGFTLSWENDVKAVLLDSGATTVVAENDFLLVDLSCGLFADLMLGERLRLYGGAGPVLQFASVDAEWDDSSIGDVDVDEDAFGGGYYARTGFEFAFSKGTTVGLGVRHLDSSVDPGGGIDSIEFEEWQYVLTATRGL
jgi:opacity protein-like surface antigen